MQAPPEDPAAQLRWLVDRAQISDLLVRYAHCADAKDWEGIAALFAEDGQVVSAMGSFPGRSFPEAAGPMMSVFSGTHHISTNHAIDLDGDAARSRSYLHAVHLTDAEDPMRHADLGGWYDHELVRTPDGWRIMRMELSVVWADGEPFTAAVE